MPTTSLTTRLDQELKTELEQIARFDKRSVSFMTNQAIRNLVEERRASRDLIRTGLALMENNIEGVSSDAVHDWLLSDEDAPFPKV
ncbi:putative transcriptional regulator [Rhodoblastus acidophilus]|nr:ribbon-helix-helix domain-containing protein [Rhodoblastus acidophilus]MCW2273459.1 putative transcriptional regulator [Rhodoblastus acidophilus]